MSKKISNFVSKQNSVPGPRIRTAASARGGSASNVTIKTDASVNTCLVVDTKLRIRRQFSDLAGFIFLLLAIVVVIVGSGLARQTVQGVSTDIVTALSLTAERILLVPTDLLFTGAVLLIPVTLLAENLWKQRWFSVGAMVMASLLALIGVSITFWSLNFLAGDPQSFFQHVLGTLIIDSTKLSIAVLSPAITAIVALVSCQAKQSTITNPAWFILWVIYLLGVLQQKLTLIGMLVSLLLGLAAGKISRWIIGVKSPRAHPQALVQAIRRVGLDAVKVIRADTVQDLESWMVTTNVPLQYRLQTEIDSKNIPSYTRPESTGENRIWVFDAIDKPLEEIAKKAHEDAGMLGNTKARFRTYVAYSANGHSYPMRVLDPDNHLAGFFQNLWNRLRFRGVEVMTRSSLRAVADHFVLMNLAAHKAGLNCPEILSVAWAQDNVVLLFNTAPKGTALTDIDPETGAGLQWNAIWEELIRASRQGLVHQNLESRNIYLDLDINSKNPPSSTSIQRVYFTDWEGGEVAAGEVPRRLDFVSLLGITASYLGPHLAIEVANNFISEEEIAGMAPLLQTPLLPAEVVAKIGRRGVKELRKILYAKIPQAKEDYFEVRRFSFRAVASTVTIVLLIWLFITAVNWKQTLEAMKQANPWLLLGAFGASLLAYLGAAICLRSFASTRVGLWTTVQVQVAGSVLSIVVPAGIGPAAVNLKYLVKQGINRSQAGITATLVQVLQVGTTFVLITFFATLNGSLESLHLSGFWLLVSLLVGIVLAGIIFFIPQLRTWVGWHLIQLYEKIGSQIAWIVRSPRRITSGIAGSFLQVSSLTTCFVLCVYAFGQTPSLLVLILTFLVSNSLGSIIPAPGGVGPVEAALTGGIVVAGVPSVIALSVALTYRLLSFWARAPLGWMAWRYLEKRGQL